LKGRYSAELAHAVGIGSMGTKPLPRKGSRISGRGRLLAVSTFLRPGRRSPPGRASVAQALISGQTKRVPVSTSEEAAATTSSAFVSWLVIPKA
jgi:hypothetical protein